MNTIYYFLAIIKERRVGLIRLLFLAIVLFAQSSCERNVVDKSMSKVQVNNPLKRTITKDKLQLKANEGRVYFKDSPFDGTSVTYYPDGEISESIDYLAGKKHGKFKKWFASGLISFESNYLHGRREGVTLSWWSNGNIRSEASYVKGIPEGIQMQWYKSGAKFKKMNLVAGRESGLQQSWRENGKLYNNYEAKNGRIFGMKRASLCFSLDNEEIQI